MMRILLAIGAATALTTSASFGGGFKSDAFAEFSSKELQVVAIDNSDGCWSQVDGAKSYLRKVLGELGYKTADTSAYRVAISVTAKRLKPVPRLTLNNGAQPKPQPVRCFGNVELLTYTLEKAHVPGTLTVFSSTETTFTNHDQVDEIVFRFIEGETDFLN